MYATRTFATFCILLLLQSVAFGAPTDKSALDWYCWQNLVVQSGGRQKPLDTPAWETSRMVSNRANVIDSDTGEKLTPTALYLTLIFEWSGWDHDRRVSMLLSKESAVQYSYFHQAD